MGVSLMARERDWLQEVFVIGLQEISMRGRQGAEIDQVNDAIQKTLRPEHLFALAEFFDVCQARIELRDRRLVTTNQPERRLQ